MKELAVEAQQFATEFAFRGASRPGLLLPDSGGKDGGHGLRHPGEIVRGERGMDKENETGGGEIVGYREMRDGADSSKDFLVMDGTAATCGTRYTLRVDLVEKSLARPTGLETLRAKKYVQLVVGVLHGGRRLGNT